MSDYSKIKVVGKRKPPTTPEERLRRAHDLQRHAEQLCPYPRPRGFVFKAGTYEEYALWRRSQKNPRLWQAVMPGVNPLVRICSFFQREEDRLDLLRLLGLKWD